MVGTPGKNKNVSSLMIATITKDNKTKLCRERISFSDLLTLFFFFY